MIGVIATVVIISIISLAGVTPQESLLHSTTTSWRTNGYERPKSSSLCSTRDVIRVKNQTDCMRMRELHRREVNTSAKLSAFSQREN